MFHIDENVRDREICKLMNVRNIVTKNKYLGENYQFNSREVRG